MCKRIFIIALAFFLTSCATILDKLDPTIFKRLSSFDVQRGSYYEGWDTKIGVNFLSQFYPNVWDIYTTDDAKQLSYEVTSLMRDTHYRLFNKKPLENRLKRIVAIRNFDAPKENISQSGITNKLFYWAYDNQGKGYNCLIQRVQFMLSDNGANKLICKEFSEKDWAEAKQMTAIYKKWLRQEQAKQAAQKAGKSQK